MKPIILASASPRRREILEKVGASFTVCPSLMDEKAVASTPAEYVEKLSFGKASEIAGRTEGPAIFVGADTVVAHKGKILGKPKNEEDAFNMLRSLSGDAHSVYTGVTVIARETDGSVKIRTFSVETKVKVAELTDEEIKNYIATGEPMDKAGAYAIQGRFAPFIEYINGDYYNVVGLPVSALYRAFEELGEKLF